MRATISIDENMLKELESFCEGKDYSEAVKQALKEYVTWKKWESIFTLGNRFEWQTDVLPKLDVLNPRNYRNRFRKNKS